MIESIPYTYIEGKPFYLPKHAEINGVRRLKATSLSLPSRYAASECMNVSKTALKRELRRAIVECLGHGGGLEDFVVNCIQAIVTAGEGEMIGIPMVLLERELRRAIEETMIYGSDINDLVLRCVDCLEADMTTV
jgi:hypothetical protein